MLTTSFARFVKAAALVYSAAPACKFVFVQIGLAFSTFTTADASTDTRASERESAS